MLADGSYDAIVVDAEPGDHGGVAVSLVLVTGEHKGDVVNVRTPAGIAEPLELLGIPATLTVRGGEPTVRFEP